MGYTQADMDAMHALLPPTFYADRPLPERIRRLVRAWREAIETNHELEARLASSTSRPAPVPLARAPQDRAALGGVPASPEPNEPLAAKLYDDLVHELVHWVDPENDLGECVAAVMAIVAASPASRSSGPTDPDRAAAGDLAAKAENE